MSITPEQILAEVHADYFFHEFTYSRTQFFPLPKAEREFADAVVLAGDALIALQVKGRESQENEEATLRKWFKKRVRDEAVTQLCDTLEYFRTCETIVVRNARNQAVDLMAVGASRIVPVVAWGIRGVAPPADLVFADHFISKRIGFVHVLHLAEYADVCATLGNPVEIIEYFDWRKDFLERSPSLNLGERRMLGQYVADRNDVLPADEALARAAFAAVDDGSFRLHDILTRLHAAPRTSSDDQDAATSYYRILREFARLPRSGKRVAAQKIYHAIDAATAGTPEEPRRFRMGESTTGFLVATIPEFLMASRIDVLETLAILAKYDWRMERQVAVMAICRDGAVELDWLYLEYPWVFDRSIEEDLVRMSPFRGEGVHRLVYRFPAPQQGLGEEDGPG